MNDLAIVDLFVAETWNICQNTFLTRYTNKVFLFCHHYLLRNICITIYTTGYSSFATPKVEMIIEEVQN